MDFSTHTSQIRSAARPAAELEASGDAAGADRTMAAAGSPRDSPHRMVLAQLIEVNDELPGWAWNRWAAYQTTRLGGPDSEVEDRRHRRAFERALSTWDDAALLRESRQGPDMLVARVMAYDWIYQQLRTYEYGGLRDFVHHVAAGRLRASLDGADVWAEAPMGGYLIERTEPSTIDVRDLRSGRTLTVLNLGASGEIDDGGYGVGRLVPIGDEPGWMFESRPLCVPESVARDVAALDLSGPSDQWVDVLADAVRAGDLPEHFQRRLERPLLSDVEPMVILAATHNDPELVEAAGRYHSFPVRERRRCAVRLMRTVPLLDRPEVELGLVAPVLAEAILQPGVLPDVRRLAGWPAYRAGWELLAGCTVGPAQSRFRGLATLAARRAA